ncbi:MAG: peptidase and in kexin sedolisin [Fibrobacteres bacterium]|nr:peptidase and in kexin sedolisin [Fibrobacterota bacterium]
MRMRRLPLVLPLLIVSVLTAVAAVENANAGALARIKQACLEVGAEDFGLARIGMETAGELKVRNGCRRDVTVLRATASPSPFRAALPSRFRIAAGGARNLPVFFTPRDTSLVMGGFTLLTDQPRQHRIFVPAKGRGVSGPAIAVSPSNLEQTMVPGASGMAHLSISNSGGERLEIIVSAKGDPVPRPEKGWKVLYLNTILTGDWEDDFYRNLRTMTNVDTAESWDATRSLPTLDRMLEYDVVVAATANPWVDAVAAGNLLADYLESGGKVCLLGTALGENTNRLFGRIESYFPMPAARTAFAGNSGTLASHPITSGVGAFYSETALDDPATQGPGQGIPLGTYASGQLIGAYHPQSPIVVLNIGTTSLSGDVYVLLGNTLDFLGTSMAWMTTRPPADKSILVVPAHGMRVLDIAFNSHRLTAGTYHGVVRLLKDAGPGINPLEVPVALRISTAGRISLESGTLDFGTVWTGGRGTRSLRMANIGNAPIRISGFRTGLPAFSVAADLPLEIPAFSHVVTQAVYAPDAIGRDSAILEIRSDADGPERMVALIGTGVSPPRITVSPDRLEASVLQGRSVDRVLTIRNLGGDSMEATLHAVVEAGPGTPGTGPARMKVLYLQTMNSGDFESDFMWNVRSLANVESFTSYAAFESTPTLDYLRAFDAVLVVAGDPWADPVALGNVLADYVDAGGKVCLMHASLSTLPGRGLGGRITSPGYAPVPSGGNGGNGFFQSAEDEPIMEGITPELYSAATMAVTGVQGSARILGRYDSGNLIGAYNLLKPVVFININPWDGDHSWQTIPLLGNVFAHLSNFHTWVRPATRRIALPPGGEAQVRVTLGMPGGPGPGTYQGRLELSHNAPGAGSPLVIPATLTVEPEVNGSSAVVSSGAH